MAGSKLLDLAPHGRGVKQEIAAVPEISFGDVLRSGGARRAFPQKPRPRAREAPLSCLPGTNIAVVGCGIGRMNAEGDDPAFARRLSAACRHASRNSSGLRMTWSAASTSTRGLRIAFACERGGDRDRGTGIAAHRLEHDIGLDAALAQLLGNDEAEIRIGDDNRTREQARDRKPAPSPAGTSSLARPAGRTASACSRATPATAVFRRRRT